MTANEPPIPECEVEPCPSDPPRYRVSDLVGSGNEAILVHDDKDYRLRITARNKLILTR